MTKGDIQKISKHERSNVISHHETTEEAGDRIDVTEGV